MKKLNPALNKYTGLPDPGFFCLSTDSEKWQDHFYSTSEINKANSFIEANRQTNCYSSIALFKQPWRGNTIVSRPLELYADIDAHETLFDEAITKEGVKAFAEKLKPYFGKIIPDPSYIVYSGRGLQLHYELKKTAPIEIAKWKAVQSSLVETLDSLVRKADKELGTVLRAKFSLDSIQDESRVLRVPETYNSKAGKFSSVIYNTGKEYSLEQILQEYGEKMFYTEKAGRREVKRSLKEVREITEEEILTATEAKRRLYKSRTKGYTIETLSRARLQDLETLIYMRNERGIIEGYRENLIRLAVEILFNLTTNGNEVLKYLEWLNKQFKKPLEGAKITYFVQYKVSTAQRCFSTGKIIEWLSITEEEQQKMRTLLNRKLVNQRYHQAHGEEWNSKKRKAYAEKYGDQNKQAREKKINSAKAMLKIGLTVNQVATALKVSRRTVYYYRNK